MAFRPVFAMMEVLKQQFPLKLQLMLSLFKTSLFHMWSRYSAKTCLYANRKTKAAA